MSKRFLFLVRQDPLCDPEMDACAELAIPVEELEHIELMIRLDPNYMKEERQQDQKNIRGIQMRYMADPTVIRTMHIVTVDDDFTKDDLSDYIKSLSTEHLKTFLKEASVW